MSYIPSPYKTTVSNSSTIQKKIYIFIVITVYSDFGLSQLWSLKITALPTLCCLVLSRNTWSVQYNPKYCYIPTSIHTNKHVILLCHNGKNVAFCLEPYYITLLLPWVISPFLKTVSSYTSNVHRCSNMVHD